MQHKKQEGNHGHQIVVHILHPNVKQGLLATAATNANVTTDIEAKTVHLSGELLNRDKVAEAWTAAKQLKKNTVNRNQTEISKSNISNHGYG